MDGTRDLSVDHHSTRLLASGHAFTAPMDNSATGHPNSQQLRPPYGDLVRPPGSPSDASSLSAYHSRYLASLPGSGFPFLSSMFTSTLPAPPTSPFRAPSSGVNSMRQFWPPTPPPDGYGRYGMNTSLFPLFGSVSPSPDNGTYITQGLVSRLGSAGHFSHLLDSHKEHSFFSPGIGLGSPLTPTSHVTPPTHFPHLIPSLERHPGFGHMTLGGKELDDGHLANDSDDVRLMKGHMDCLVKQDIPSRHSSGERAKSKSEKHSEKSSNELHRTPPPLWTAKDKQEEVKSVRKSEARPQQQLLNKVPPCKVEVSCSPTGKQDLLSPTSKTVKPEVSSSPVLVSKKSVASPVPVPVASSPVSSSSSPETSHVDKSEARCSQCAASLKGVGVATKLGGCATEVKSTPEILPLVFHSVPDDKDNPVYSNNIRNNSNVTSTVVAMPTPTDSVVTNLSHSGEVVRLENSVSRHNSPDNTSFTPSFEQTPKTMPYQPLNRTTKSDVHTTQSHTSVTCKHVTAAVIPTAPKQTVQREIHPDSVHISAPCGSESEKSAKHVIPEVCPVKPETASQPLNVPSCVKAESSGPVTTIDSNENNITEVVFSHNTSKPVGKSMITCYKVKDMLKTGTTLHPASVENASNVVTHQNADSIVSAKVSAVDVTSKTPMLSCSPLSGTMYPSATPKIPCKSARVQPGNVEMNKSFSPVTENKNNSPLKSENPVNSLECDFSQKPSSTGWTKATVLPFNWQKNVANSDEQQAINLTVAKKTVKMDSPEPMAVVPCIRNPSPTLQKPVSNSSQSIKVPISDSVINSSTGVIGVCHPNPNTLISNTKSKVIAVTSANSSVSNVSSTLVPSQSETTTTATTELFVTHRSTKSVIPVAVRNSTPPVLPKSSLPQVTASVNIHSKTLKSERLTTKRGKLIDSDKVSHGGRGTLATLAPKLSKNMTFAKDGSTSHTLSTSSSVSSTSIVFPATVNPCIPVGIAIAQQRQDSSATASIGKPQSSVSSAAPVTMTSAHLTTTRVSQEIQPQLELVRDQKGQEITCSTNPGSADSTNLLVTQGPTIVSRQWESEAVTRTALPSPWITHGSVVAPAVWLGQGTYAATAGPTSTTVPSVPMSSLETSPISLPPGGYQLARDSITGHLFLIPSANIEIVDRSATVWPSFSAAPTSTLPIQQLVTQQQHTQFEQVLPQIIHHSLLPLSKLQKLCPINH